MKLNLKIKTYNKYNHNKIKWNVKYKMCKVGMEMKIKDLIISKMIKKIMFL